MNVYKVQRIKKFINDVSWNKIDTTNCVQYDDKEISNADKILKFRKNTWLEP